MGRKLKKGKVGNAAQYLTRNQAIKKLQLRLSEFRRLCILKGIHPREPKKKVKGANKTYYHVKDINWLAHEPLIQTFREVKVHERKVRKARAKQNLRLAQRLMRLKPGYRLDHLIKERYPSFVDAVRDLDDALTLTHLFACLPAESRYDIPGPAVEKCRRLTMEWQAYCAKTSGLRKCFISVKGFYYQAEVLGQPVTWLVPHHLAQVLPADVDYRVMTTFLDFYTTLLQFVLFKLYHGLGLRYPPVLDQQLEKAAAGLAGIMRDIAGLGQDAQQQQQQGEEGQGGTAAAAGEAPEVVQRLTSLSGKIKQLQAKQGGKGGAAAAAAGDGDELGSEDEGEGLEIDSGPSGSESQEDSEEGQEEGEEEEGEESEEEESVSEGGEQEAAGASGQQQQQQGQGAGSREPGGEGSAVADGAAAAGGALGVVSGDDDAELCQCLFKGLVFFLAREVPREPLLFVIRAFGGVAAWEGEGSPHAEGDEAITHQVVDRPTQGHRFLSRVYVQPQWVVDSANHRVLMPVSVYEPGKAPPPHLSPFVDYQQEGYTPDWAVTVQKLQAAAKQARQRAAGTITEAEFLASGGDATAEEVAEAAAAAGGGEEAAAAAAEVVYREELQKELRGGAAGEESEEEEGAEEREQQEEQQQQPVGKRVGRGAEGDEVEQMADIMMSRKKRKLYERIKRAQEGKEERVEVLKQRKRLLQQQGGGEQQQQQQGSKRQNKQKGK